MLGKSICVLAFAVLFWSCTNADDHRLLLSDNSPVTVGSTVTLNATVLDSNGRCASGVLIFHYEDDALPRNSIEIKIKQCEAIFHIPFSTEVGPSSYRYRVDVSHQLIPLIIHPIASGRGQFNVTENLNGQLQIFQNNTKILNNPAQTTYVSSKLEVVHKVELNAADFDYLNKSANSIAVYWFVDCVYKGNTTSFTFSSNYTESDSQHEILGIVVANVDQNISRTTPLPVTTTTASSNVITLVNSTADNATTASLTNSSTTTLATPFKTDVINYNIIKSIYTPDCEQKKYSDLLLSEVMLENQQKYGYFSRMLIVKDPISNVRGQGKVWIQEGEMLNLQVNCNGSGPIRYCAYYKEGPYNVMGNESCSFERNLVQCQMQFFHYFRKPTNYTLVIITTNDVSKVITPIGINIYKVQKQPQISVIVVPVTFSSIAIIIVVFGIAYYFQNRSRYMVEVADFDFANNSDMEYKTFRERLRDAISQAINRTQDYSEYDGSEEKIGDTATLQNQKYGSMK